MKTILLFFCASAFSLIAFAQNSDLAVRASTGELTDLSKQIGLQGISVSQKQNVYTYVLAGQEMIISNMPVNLDGDVLTAIESDEYIGISYHNISLNLSKKERTVTITNGLVQPFPLSDLTEKTFGAEDFRNAKIAFVLLNEIANVAAARSESASKQMIPRHSIVVINFGTSSSSSGGSTKTEAAQYIQNHPGCTLTGSLETTCAWVFCISTQTITCP